MTHKYSDGSGFSFGFDDRGPDTHLKWDKCVPSEIEFDDNVDEFKLEKIYEKCTLSNFPYF